ncbi:hypothetical protein V8F06_000827 [Rhypophila decipiens]
MDDYMFQQYVQDCKCVEEATSYLEIYNYSDGSLNTSEEHRFRFDELPDEFVNFLHRRGAFAPPKLKEGVHLTSGIRLILQLNAQQNDTFSPRYISLSHKNYELMVRNLKLPFRAIEGTSVVGPFFWCAFDQDDDDPHLQIIFRKSDVRKKGKTRGWEIMLSHSFNDGITTGFVKGTPSSDMVASIKHLKACAQQIMHPMLLPTIILSHDLSGANDVKQRDAREWLRKLEHAVSMRQEILEEEVTNYVKDSMVDLDQINRDLVECHSQVLWKRPQAYQEIIKSMVTAMDNFWTKAQDDEKYGGRGGTVDKLHRSILARLDFYQAKLKGIENYAHITLERLHIQRAALYNIIAQKESKLGLEMAGEQRRLAHAAKRDSNSMKTLSLLGAIFLPATYLASLFSMTFFDFQDQKNNYYYYYTNGSSVAGSGGTSPSSPEDDGNSVVSPFLWIYFVVTIPLTAAIVLAWRLWDKRRERKYAQEDVAIELGIDEMERRIMAQMRKRTMSKVRTWDVGVSVSAASKLQ